MKKSAVSRQILLADDDNDDVVLFKDAIEQLRVAAKITIVKNGEALMRLLEDAAILPDIIFLDLNMPLKNGIDCLSAIRQSEKLRSIPVVVLSTSNEAALVQQLYKNGARYYICKPNDFDAFKNVIGQAIALTGSKTVSQPAMDKFVLTS